MGGQFLFGRPLARQRPACRRELRRSGRWVRACESIERAFDSEGARLYDVGVNHCGAEVGVAEQFLNGSDVGAGLEKVSGN